MIKCITLNENYTNLKRSYMSFELPNVYFELKKAYKDFDRSHWLLLAYRILEKYKWEELITLNNDIIISEDKIYYRVYYYGTVENILDAIVYGAEFIISNGKLYVANLI